LFGHVKGAFTGADRDRDGKFDAAQKGTLLLDEIGDMPLDLQAKLLRVLQERCYQKVGSNKTIKAECRVIATTHRDLKAMVKEGKFREDLYHRLCMFPITIPPLRERREDIPLLVSSFMEQFQKELGRQLPGVSRAAMNAMLAYPWPGNVRELRNCLERATILTDGELITPSHLGIVEKDGADEAGERVSIKIDLPVDQFSLDAAVNRLLEVALERCDGNRTKAADFLKVNRKMFNRRID
ncbi:MAG: sigma-54 dependent transcriptional regulator, partial [Nitrospirota bacterium]|nr:sigma-54 dependent transcriptional regulator [Nitrospirota bacterium]